MRILGTFGSLTTARLGMYASQQGLNVTGHNISNINTPGYSRQKLDQMALRTGNADRFGSTYNALPGSGVLCTGISQIRDPFLDIRFRNTQSSVGAMDAKLDGLEDLARILDEISRSEGEGIMEAQFNDLKKQIENLSDKVGQGEFDTAVRNSAIVLVRQFNDYAQQLKTVKENQAGGFKKDIDRVNTILKNIGDLNSSIMKAEIHGDSAPELRDQRNLLIDELSQYTKITVEYQNVSVGAGKTAETLSIYLGGSSSGDPATSRSTLVDGNYFTQFSIRQVPQDPTDPDSPMMDSPNFDLDLAPLIDSKNNIMDPTAGSIQLGDNDLYGSLQATREILTEAGEFTDASVINGIPADPGPPPVDAVDPVDIRAATKRGIPYYQKSLDALAQKFAAVLNGANTNYSGEDTGFLKNSEGEYVNAKGESLGTVLDNNVQANGVKLGGILFSNSSDNNNPADITASNISISKDWAVGNIKIANSFVMMNNVGNKWDPANGNPARPGSTDTSNLMHILAQFDAKHSYTAGDINPDAYEPNSVYFPGSFQEMLGNMNNTLANDINSTSSLLTNHAASANSINTSRDSVSGVDLNDETTYLMQYQKSFSAACRLMTTMDEALEKLINGTGIVGR